jgi:DNA primase
MADQVEEIKERADIVSLISERIELKKAGRNFKANCPFHSEKTPSFMVSPELQIYKCFGCGEGGDAISFLQKYEGMEFYEALKYLADRTGVKLIPRVGLSSENEKLFNINRWASRFYHYILFNHSSAREALNYLTKVRKIKTESIKTFGVGYSPNIPEIFKKFFLDKKGFSPTEIERVGLGYTRGGSVQDRFSGRIIFPLFDHRGNVAGFSGRILPGREKADTGKYINTPETPIYHKSKILYGLNLSKKEIKKKGEAIVVEGELDAISPWQVGIRNIVAIKGSAFTSEQARLLSRFSENVTLALDSDIAGNIAARRGIETADQEGLRIKVANLGDYKDPDEAAQKDPKALKTALSKASVVWDYLIDSTFSQYKNLTGEVKATLSHELVPILAKIRDEIVRAHYIKVVSERLEVPYDAVLKEVERQGFKPKEKATQTSEIVTEEKKPRRDLLEEKLLGLAFLSNPKIIINKEFVALIKSSLGVKLLESYSKYSKKFKTFKISRFSDFLAEELKQGFSEIILKVSSEGEPETETQLKKEISDLTREVKMLDIKEKQRQLTEKMKMYEKSGDKSKLKISEKKFDKLSGERLKLEGNNR